MSAHNSATPRPTPALQTSQYTPVTACPHSSSQYSTSQTAGDPPPSPAPLSAAARRNYSGCCSCSSRCSPRSPRWALSSRSVNWMNLLLTARAQGGAILQRVCRWRLRVWRWGTGRRRRFRSLPGVRRRRWARWWWGRCCISSIGLRLGGGRGLVSSPGLQ